MSSGIRLSKRAGHRQVRQCSGKSLSGLPIQDLQWAFLAAITMKWCNLVVPTTTSTRSEPLLVWFVLDRREAVFWRPLL
jgi:hypothetical protein